MAAEQLPRNHAEIKSQLKRAALSIPLNIAEGNGKWHKKDRQSYFLTARGSAFECASILSLCSELELTPAKEAEVWRQELAEVGRMLTGLIKGLEKRDEH